MPQLKKWIPAFIVMTIIFVASSTPGKVINDLGFGKESYHIDAHFILFFTLCITYYKATNSIIKSILLTVLFGVSDEFHQHFVPLRSVSTFDVLVDTVGAMLAGLLIWMLPLKIQKKLKN